MSLSEIDQPSWLNFDNNNPFCTDNYDAGEYSFSPPFSSTEHSPQFSSSMQCLETILSDDDMEFPIIVNELHAIDDFETVFDEYYRIFNGDGDDDMAKPLDETYRQDHGEWDHDHAKDVCETSVDMTSVHPSLVLPFEGMEIDNVLCLLHLLTAYCEARNNHETTLSEVIAQQIIRKADPAGGVIERLLYYMFQHLNEQPNCLGLESIKNFYLALKAFYQMFPYGKFAHLVANSVILESMPRDVEIVYLIDFDIGEGIQWASFMEASKHLHKEIRIISLKSSEEDDKSPLRWTFQETKMRLTDLSWSYGLKIEVEEVGLQDLESIIKNKRKGDHGRKSYYAFNCNVLLPHMGRTKSTKDVFNFLNLAKDLLNNVRCYDNCKGIITYGDGDATDDTTSTSCGYKSFLDANFVHYRALLESMEFDFPNHLGKGRIALECLFVAPYVSSIAWDRKWEEKKQFGNIRFGLGLEGWRLSEASLVEAKEIVKEGVGLYGVKIDSGMSNEMVLEWNGVPIVRVCCWRS